jgi:hypothetical protein
MQRKRRCLWFAVAVLGGGTGLRPAAAQIAWQRPAQGRGAIGVVNVTNDYTVRHWANYHNTQCWSPDGRYVCYTRFASDGRQVGSRAAAEVHVFDLQTGRSRFIDKGQSPRWANHRNYLFYSKILDGPEDGAGSQVWWLDLDTGRRVRMGIGMNYLGGTSFDDQWLFGGALSKVYRMPVREEAEREYLPGLDNGKYWIPNPAHNAVFARFPNQDPFEFPFAATRYWFDIDGRNIRMASEFLTRCHQSWLGNGEYFMLGNGQVRGRKWDDPFPGSAHFLAAVSTGDVNPAGRSGRFVIGDKPMAMADLRSGDGWQILEDLSVICYPEKTKDDSGHYDSDAKGSPDGTKMGFVSTYDLVRGPVTFITRSAPDGADRVEVQSTKDFPPSGEIVVFREVIGYTRKTPTSFEGLVHKKYGTSGFDGRKYSAMTEGEAVTSWAARLIPLSQWKTLPLPAPEVQRSMGGMPEPLIRQKSSDVWLAQIRRPDRPYLRATDGRVQLIPGESHYETRGYHLYRDGAKVTPEPLRPGETRELAPGSYTAVAVEWSGLESEKCNALRVDGKSSLSVLRETPADFSWTWDQYLVEGKEATRAAALQSNQAVRETHHRYDGIIARESYEWGRLKTRHDLNAGGKAIRRQIWHQRRLFQREYHNRSGEHVSTEFLDESGMVNESVRYRRVNGRDVEFDHWWYVKGMPERRISALESEPAENPKFVMHVRAGDKWVKADHLGEPVPPQDAAGLLIEWDRKAAK